jgi:uncharacterized protein YyaL (SSP411 family)
MPEDIAGGDRTPNHLAREKSLYLRQHVLNPVDWYPWGDEAFRRAAAEDKPVFLSIGYATCHWCHVMAHESFGDRKISSLLNENFIAIKVDREERPDIDSIYMAACQQMTGQGGWPLTIIMTPEKQPFFAGTYLPPRSRHGMTGLDDLLTQIARLWKEKREMLGTAAGDMIAYLDGIQIRPAGGTADRSLLDAGYRDLALSFDPVNGGFARAPKFPAPTIILFLLRYWNRTGSAQALSMAEATLGAICCGGIHDQIGGGFHRYSTDPQWRVPHFEKMLYDQALLLMACTEAWLATGKPLWRRTAESIVTYVSRELVSPKGAFYSAEDADSEGGEGAFYLWTRQEIADTLGPKEGRFAAGLFGAAEEGNFPSPGPGPGKNILYLPGGDYEGRYDLGRIAAVRARLLAERERRPHPLKDRKILTDWNSLMIAALALASRAFQEQAYAEQAERAMHFILDTLKKPGGGLLHRWCDGEAAIPAFADDYAFAIRALVELYETSFDPAWLGEAIVMEQYLRDHFLNREENGYYFTADTADPLPIRKMEIHDGASPSANSVMLQNLVSLEHLTGNPRYAELASAIADGFSGTVRRSPSAFTAYLCGLDHLLGPATDVVVTGTEEDPSACGMLRIIRSRYLPACSVHYRTPGRAQFLDTVAPFTTAMDIPEEGAAAYVCTGNTCSPAVKTAEELQGLLPAGTKK